MNLLNDVFADYLGLPAKYGRVPGTSNEPASLAIKSGVPGLLNAAIMSTSPRRNPNFYRCYGGHGEAMRSFAAVPWVACCRRELGTSVQAAYFIVILFDQQMRGCWLSLNQGFTQYEKAFGAGAAARRASRDGAVQLARMITAPPGFVKGPIQLSASTDLGKGYEVGAICSRFYAAAENVTESELTADFLALLDIYDDLAQRVGRHTIALLPDVEGLFQEAALKAAKSKKGLPALAPGPVAPPTKIASSSRGGFRRSPLPAAHALRNAKFQCEVDTSHSTFVARTTGENFVEAHHIIPMAAQGSFQFSIDVAENIVALCPNCHRQVHHGKISDRTSIVAKLFHRRSPRLATKGIVITETEIRAFYRYDLEDD